MNIVSDIKEMVEKWKLGLIVKYVNTEGLTNKKINEYLQLLKDKTTINEEYNVVPKMKKDAFEKGGMVMSTWFNELVAETNEKCRQEGTKNLLDRLVEQGLLSAEEAKRQLEMIKINF